MESGIVKSRNKFIEGLSRISHFWGFSKVMGATYGALYLSPEPLALDDLVKHVGVSKGSISTNVRQLEQFGMVHKHFQIGDRKDYYTAETDFTKIIRGIVRVREKVEFDRAVCTVVESIDMLNNSNMSEPETKLAAYSRERMQEMKIFFDSVDRLVAAIIAVDELNMGVLDKLFGKTKKKSRKKKR